MRKILKWTGIVVSIPVALILLISVLLYVPVVQDYIVRKATVYASEATGMEIHIRRIRLGFPLNLVVDDVQVIQQPDTLLNLERLQVDVQMLPLLRQQVEIDGIHLRGAQVNTSDLIATMQLQATLGSADLVSHGISLADEQVILNSFNLSDANLHICMKDTVVPEDTTESAMAWQIRLLESQCKNVQVTVQMNDTTTVGAGFTSLLLKDADIDLGNSAYALNHLVLHGGSVTYDADTLAVKAGLDPAHLALSKMHLELDSLYYDPAQAALRLTSLSLQERSGLTLLSAEGKVRSDSTHLSVPRFTLQTGDSYAELSAEVPWKSLEAASKETLTARFLAELGKNDLMTVLGDAPQSFVQNYPNAPVQLRAGVDGNMTSLHITGLQARLDGAFEATMEGRVEQVLDSLHRAGELEFALQTQDLDFLTAYADSTLSGQYHIPNDMTLLGNAAVEGNRYDAVLNLDEHGGSVALDAHYNADAESYKLDLTVDSLRIDHFLPKDSMYALTAAVQWEGEGLDPYAARTRTNLKASLDHWDYGHWQLRNFDLTATLLQHDFNLSLLSDNALLKLRTALEGRIEKSGLQAMLDVHLEQADLYAMQVTEDPMTAAANFHLNAKTDFEKALTLKGYLQSMNLKTAKKEYQPKDLYFETFTTADSTYASVRAGDLRFTLEGGDYAETLLAQLNRFAETVQAQIDLRDVRPDLLRSDLPNLCLKVNAGNDNPISNFLALQGVSYERFFVDMDTSPDEGINAESFVYALHNDSILLDTIRFNIEQDSATVRFSASVHNAPSKKRPTFDAHVDGSFDNTMGQVRVHYFDEDHATGLDLGAGVEWKEEGIRLHLLPEQPVIAFDTFQLNDDNQVWFYKNGGIEGDIKLVNDEGTGFRFFSVPNEDSSVDLTFSLTRINLGQVMRILPFAPDIKGILDTEVHYLQSDDRLSLMAETSIDSLSYEQCYIGRLSNSSIYLPKENDTHYVDTRFSLEDEEIVALSGNYQNVGEGHLDMNLAMEHFPMQVVNGFIPDRMVALTGDIDGTLDVCGSPSKPICNGEVMLDSLTATSEMYGVRFLFDTRPVTITDSKLAFNEFSIYTKADNPFTIDGTVDFSDLERTALNLRMRAKDYELINAKRTRQSLVDGKVIVDFFAMVRGRVDDLTMRGSLTVQSKTDVTYLLQDTPLTVEDRLSDLVTFVNFKDTTQVEQAEAKQYSMGGMDINLNVTVAQGARIRVDLSEDRHSYVELQGSGDLTMSYSPQGDLTLYGRYTLTGGEMKYELPVIPLKTFNISDGSYVQFNGDVMNPTMNITATERMRASVTQDNVSRNVSFDVGVSITNTLSNMGLEFTLDAPEDMTLSNELASMSAEERGKLAVGMLATGLYLGTGESSGGFNANNALNSFLQSEINNIAGNALKSVDISLGVEDNTSSDGSSRTDYSFSFSKRLWNDRVSIIIGGTVSSGSSTDTENSSFIDNVSLEYRLDDTATRYIRLFHSKNYESVLEGQITETGIGLVLRRKMTKFGELFIFSNSKKKKQANTGEVAPKQ